MDDEADGIFNIALSDSESEEKTTSKPAGRTDQSEEAYQAVKRTYHAKVENGDVSHPSPANADASVDPADPKDKIKFRYTRV